MTPRIELRLMETVHALRHARPAGARMTPLARCIVSVTPAFKPGDPPPAAYCAWHEWAKVQYKGGLRQKQCPKCGLWRFPQETCCGK